MSRQSFRELVSFLTNKETVEDGYSKRDLALSALVGFHYFNLEKAIGGPPPQVRSLQLSAVQRVDVFPGLSEEQFESVIRYAYEEKWPLTTRGLFSLLKRGENKTDDTLVQAFCHTPEFYKFQMFFKSTGSTQDVEALLGLITEGSWDLLDKWAGDQLHVVNFSEEKRRELLLSYFAERSQTAAHLLLVTDFVFTLKRFEDRAVLDLLSLLKKKTQEGTRFCVELLKSPRGDAIRQAAAMTLYSYVGEIPTTPIDLKAVLSRFDPTSSISLRESKEIAKVVAPAPVKEEAPSVFHVVKEGESLWKISRQYKVKVDDLVKMNGLEKDSLFPGMTLKIR